LGGEGDRKKFADRLPRQCYSQKGGGERTRGAYGMDFAGEVSAPLVSFPWLNGKTKGVGKKPQRGGG